MIILNGTNLIGIRSMFMKLRGLEKYGRLIGFEGAGEESGQSIGMIGDKEEDENGGYANRRDYC